MLFRKQKFLGLDIGTSSMKVAELNVSSKGISLENFALFPTPVGSIQGGEVVEPVSISNAIRELLAQIQTKRKNAVIGVWGTSVVVKKISVPKMDVSLLKEQIKWEAEQYIPFDLNEVHLEFAILKSHSSPDTMDLLLVAARSATVFKYVEIVETAGFQCPIVDVSSIALANCYEVNYPDSATQTAALLNIGAGVTHFVVYDRGNIVFSRDIPIGGLTYTNDLHKQMGISLDEAENLKVSACMGQPVPQTVLELMAATNETVAEEIARTLAFYNSTSSEVAVRKIYLTGGCAAVLGLAEGIQKLSQLPTEILNCFAKIKYNSKKFSIDYINQITPFASVAIGLGLRGEKEK